MCYNGQVGQGCYGGAPECPDPVLQEGGTLMSYCHFGGASGADCDGVTNDFHPTVATFVRTFIDAHTFPGCITSLCDSPNAPTSLMATPNGDARIDLQWTASTPPPTPDSYTLYRSTSPGGPYAPLATGLTVTTYSDTAVTAGLTYYYVVRALSASCISVNSNEASALALGDCDASPTFYETSVTNLTDGACGAQLSWTTGTNHCGTDPLVYTVYRSTSPEFTPAPANRLASCVSDTFFDDTSAIAGTDYFYEVVAEDASPGQGGDCRDGNATGSGELFFRVGTETLYRGTFEDPTGGSTAGWSNVGFGGDQNPDPGWDGVKACPATSSPNVFSFGGTASCTDPYPQGQYEVAVVRHADGTGIVVPPNAMNVRLRFQATFRLRYE